MSKDDRDLTMTTVPGDALSPPVRFHQFGSVVVLHLPRGWGAAVKLGRMLQQVGVSWKGYLAVAPEGTTKEELQFGLDRAREGFHGWWDYPESEVGQYIPRERCYHCGAYSEEECDQIEIFECGAVVWYAKDEAERKVYPHVEMGTPIVHKLVPGTRLVTRCPKAAETNLARAEQAAHEEAEAAGDEVIRLKEKLREQTEREQVLVAAAGRASMFIPPGGSGQNVAAQLSKALDPYRPQEETGRRPGS